MKLIKLAKQLDFDTEYEYFDYCINSHANGNFDQCKELFKAMTKKDRKNLMDYMDGCFDHPKVKAVYRFYWSLF